MPFAFDHPALLLLLLLGGPIVWLGVTRLRVLDKTRLRVALMLRLMVLLFIVLMLAGLRAQRVHTDLTVMAVVDRSASVRVFGNVPDTSAATSVDEHLITYLEKAASDRRTDDKLGLVTFDARPSIRVRPAPSDSLNPGTLDEPREGTDIARAIEFALAAKQDADTALRLVLATDGNGTAGDLLAAARSAAAAGVAIDVLPVTYRIGEEVMVEGVYAPPEAREGQTVPVRVVLRATRPAAGTLQLLHDDRPLDLNGSAPGTGVPIPRNQWVNRAGEDTTPGMPDTPETPGTPASAGVSNTPTSADYLLVTTLDVPLRIAGPNTFTAVFEPATASGEARRSDVADNAEGRTDTARLASASPRSASGGDLLVNNRAQSFTQVSGKGKVLVVNNIPGASGDILPNALRSRGIELDVLPPTAFPATMVELQRYDAVLLQDVPSDQITPQQQQMLVRYVHDLGGGFAMVGGPNSFGAGGWTNSPVDAQLLPVTCQIPSQTILPSGALVFVIDRSGSMFSPVSGSNKTQMDIAKEAVELALRTLYPQDLVGVVAFDSTAKWIVPLEENSDPDATAKLIRSLEPGGGTDIYAGLIAAYEELASSKGRIQDNGIKHVIVVSDGQSPGNFQQLVADMRRAGITVSTVGVGDGHDGTLLGQIAQLGDGNYYPVNDPNNLPQVFIKEARTIRKNLIKETEFVPTLVNTGSPITTGMNATPQLRGLVLTGPRLDRRVETPLLGPEGEPLFAHWQVGLGRAAAFTSDATNRWAANWLTWNGYADFWARTVRYIARPSATRDADLVVSLEDNQLRIRLDATAVNADGSDSSTTSGAAAGFGDNLVVRGGVLAPDGSIMPVTLSQTGPGLYEANLPASQAGNYIANLYLDSPDGERRSVFGGATRPPGEELRRFSPDLGLLKQVAQETGGRLLLPQDPAAHGLFARTTEFRSISSRPLRWDLLPWLLLLVLLDVANRRVAWDARASMRWVRQRFTARRDEQAATETMTALKRRKATSTVAVSDDDQAAVPVASTVSTKRKFEAAPDAVAQPDFATAVGGATREPVRIRTNDGDNTDTQDAPTTNRLLAAKRRARQEQEEG